MNTDSKKAEMHARATEIRAPKSEGIPI
jgi:hypothetical protein